MAGQNIDIFHNKDEQAEYEENLKINEKLQTFPNAVRPHALLRTESKTDLQSGGFRSGGFCHVSIILISLKRKMKENERK